MTKQIKGLGKGLDAIFQNNGISQLAQNNNLKSGDSTVREIPLDKISPNPSQPRTIFNQEAIDELAQSIKRLGIIQPITVRDTDDGKYLIISGERRYKASLLAGLSAIPAYIRKANDQELLEMALVENIQREELNAIEIALTFQRLLNDCNLTQEQLSDRVGKKRSTIANYVRLLSLSVEVQAALRKSIISMGHARAIAALDNNADQLYILEHAIENQLSVRQTEELVAKINNPKNYINNKKTQPLHYKDICRNIADKIGLKVSISQNNKGVGSINIRFENEEQLNKIKNIITQN